MITNFMELDFLELDSVELYATERWIFRVGSHDNQLYGV